MSQSKNIETPWSPWHNRLHKSLKIKSDLLPFGSCLLLAISGGQDSMVLLKLIADLQRLYKWDLHIWHGNHGWHKESKKIAAELEIWCGKKGFNFECHNASLEQVRTEEAARNWRYEKLLAQAKLLSSKNKNCPCKHVLTGHTATDQTETLIMNLARGTYLGGLSSLKESRKLDDDIKLIRPLLIFSREETDQICKELDLPIWVDPSNIDLTYKRNKVRHKVIPILEEMHPGSTRRIASLAERLSYIKDNQDSLISIAMETITNSEGLDRVKLGRLPQQTRIIILAKWLEDSGAPNISAPQLEELSNYILKKFPPGVRNFSKGLKIIWNKESIKLVSLSDSK